MFRFFRRARESAISDGNVARFLRYSLGEILLVVVGILIALQINNWNEERLEQKEIREYALNLASAIERDMKMLVPVDEQVQAAIMSSNGLAEYLRERDIDEITNSEMFFFNLHIGYRPYGWNRAEIEQLKSSGGLRQMENARLVQLISDYDSLTHHLDQDYREDRALSSNIENLFNQLIDQNYDPERLERLNTWEDGELLGVIDQRLFGFREFEEFKWIDSLNRPLLSQDIARFRQLANISLEFADSAYARPFVEHPRLREFAAEIQALIAQEYQGGQAD